MAGKFCKQNRGRSVAINTILCIRMIRSIRAIPSCIAITAAPSTWLASHILIYINFLLKVCLGAKSRSWLWAHFLREEVRRMGSLIAMGAGYIIDFILLGVYSHLADNDRTSTLKWYECSEFCCCSCSTDRCTFLQLSVYWGSGIGLWYGTLFGVYHCRRWIIPRLCKTQSPLGAHK